MVKSVTRILLSIVLVSIFSACTNRYEKQKENSNLISLLAVSRLLNATSCSSSTGGFWARNLMSATLSSYCVNSTLIKSSTYADFYVQSGLNTNLDYNSVASLFDSTVYPVEAQAFGSPSDINKDKKVTILVMDIVDGATSTSGFIAGYVDPVNFYTDDSGSALRSNQREILYMDGVELLSLRTKDLSQGKKDTFMSTLAHEFQHLIRFPVSQGTDDSWIDEGTSEVASDITGYGPQTSRIDCYRGATCAGGISSQTSSAPSLFNWQSSLKNYAFSYVFMRYLYENSGSTLTEKNTFLSSTVKGSNGVRASNIQNLMNIYISSAAKYNSTNLGSDAKTVFKRLYVSLLAQSFYSLTAFNSVYFGGSADSVNASTLVTAYPVPTDFASLKTNDYYGYYSTEQTYSLSPSQATLVLGTTTGASASEAVVVSNTGGNRYFIFNGDIYASKNAYTSVSADFLAPITYPKLELSQEGTEGGIQCLQDHMKQVHAIDKARYNMQLYRGANE